MKNERRNMTTFKLALLWPRDVPKWQALTPQDYRLHRVFEALPGLLLLLSLR
jgi:hypothetical protein